MDLIDYLSIQAFRHDYLITTIILFGEDAVYAAIAMGIVIADDIEIKLNVQ